MSAVEDIGQMSAGVEQIDEPSQSVPNRIEEASDAGDILRPTLMSNSKELLLEDEEEEEEESGEEDDGVDFCRMMVCGVVVRFFRAAGPVTYSQEIPRVMHLEHDGVFKSHRDFAFAQAWQDFRRDRLF
ncbi:hypothetical protein PQX77_000431 [Marasmius sp. AFHP31]|nr:hypothetical protein PQX77_000431 [Marasmius sp. AFHP31]